MGASRRGAGSRCSPTPTTPRAAPRATTRISASASRDFVERAAAHEEDRALSPEFPRQAGGRGWGALSPEPCLLRVAEAADDDLVARQFAGDAPIEGACCGDSAPQLRPVARRQTWSWPLFRMISRAVARRGPPAARR